MIKITAKDRYFARGLAVALGIIHHGFGESSMARMVMEEAGYSLEDLEAAGCEDHDLEGIREDLSRKRSP